MRRAGRRCERGVVAVVVALTLVGLMLIAALVLDVGQARSTAVSSQAAVDAAALAGGPSLAGGQPEAACEQAVRYLQSNATQMASLSPATFCSPIPTSGCVGDGTTQSTATQTLGSTVLTITYPVPASQIAVARAPGPWQNDGTACQRMRVQLTASNPTTFARVIGVRDVPVTRSATVKGVLGTGTKVPALWLLDPTGCVALSVGGGAQVKVGTSTVSGLIAVDSDGSTCNSNQVTVSASGSGTSLTAVPTTGSTAGQIKLFALPVGATTCSAPACDPADVAGSRLLPQPVRASARATRTPVDWRYNCKTSYPTYHGVTLAGCPTGTPAYLDNLKAAIGTTGQPTGFQKWSSTYSCNPSGTITAAGNWWVDCSGGLTIGNGTTITFSGGNVVFDKALSMTGGTLTFNSANANSTLSSSCLPPTVTTPCTTASSSAAAWVLVRNGEWKVTGGQLNVNHTTVVMSSGYIQINGNPPTWTAPTQGPFAGLSYWSELSSNKFSIAGGAGPTLSGVFFTPEASPFTLSGNGNWSLPLASQFISYQFAVTGGSAMNLVPDDTLVGLPTMTGLLIR